NEEAYLLLIDYYTNEDFIDRALEAVDQAINNYNYTVEFYLRKAQLLIQLSKFDEALEMLDNANMLSPGAYEIQFLRIEILILNGAHYEAQVLIEIAKSELRSKQTLSTAYLLEGKLHKHNSNEPFAQEALFEALQLDPRNEEALELYWNSLERNKQYSLAVRNFAQLIDIDPYSHLAWYYYGHALSYVNEYKKAIEAYEYTYIIQPGFENAYKDFAQLALELRQFHAVVDCCIEFRNQFSDDAEILKFQALSLQALGQWAEAIEVLSTALSLEPFDDEVLFNLGLSYSNVYAYEQAIRYMNRAIEIESEREDYFIELAKVYHHIEDYDRAANLYLEALAINPDEELCWLNYAAFLTQIGHGEEAIDVLQEAELIIDNAKILFAKVACLFSLGQRKEGLYWLKEALEEDFEEHSTLFVFNESLENDSEVLLTIANAV
ncbi:MAG: CDC27 family protein, partial [Bacteroidota bacterium]